MANRSATCDKKPKTSSAASDRDKRYGLAVSSSVLSKAATIVLQIGVMPVAIRKLGVEQYGLYAFMTSFLSLISFSELGIGARMVREFSHLHVSGDRVSQKDLASSAFFLMAMAGTGIATLISVGVQFVPLNWFVRPEYQNYAIIIQRCAPFVCLIGLILLLSGVFQRIQAGFQELHHANLSCGIGNLLTIVGVCLFHFLAPSIIALILCFYSGQIIASVANAIRVVNNRPWLTPSLRHFKSRLAMELFHDGLHLSMNQSLLPLLQRDFSQWILLKSTSATASGQFAICLQIATLIGGGVGLFIAPFYAAIPDALAKKEFGWVETNMRRMLRFCCIFSVLLLIILYCAGHQIITFWLGNRLSAASQSVLVMFGIYVAGCIFYNVYYVFTISIRHVRSLTVVSLIQAVLVVGVVPTMARTLGLFGVFLTLSVLVLFGSLCFRSIYNNVFREASSHKAV